MDPSVNRRQFLKRGASFAGLSVAALALPELVAACSSSSGSKASSATTTPGSGGDLGTVTFQLSWVENVQFAGSYIAVERGFYRDAGLSGVTLLPGGPTTSVEPIVAEGKALVGSDSPDRTASARAQGAPLKVIATTYQKSPYCMLSLAKAPIETPAQMKGKTIGLPSGDESIWDAFLKVAGIDASEVHTVPVQSDPAPLAAGDVDGWVAFSTNEPIVLEMRGVAVHTFLFDDFGYHLFADTYCATEDAIANERDKIKAFLTGEVRGWQVQVAQPSVGVDLAVSTFGKSQSLDQDQQTREAQAQNLLIADADTKAHGLLTMTADKIAANITTLAAGGIHTTADDLFDTSIIDEIFDGKATL